MDDIFEEDTIESLTNELQQAKEESRKNWEALQHLMAICKIKGFDPFAEETLPPEIRYPSVEGKSIWDMTRQELIERNKESAKRIVPRANNPDKLAQPSFEQVEKLYSERVEEMKGLQSLIEHLESGAKSGEWRKIKFLEGGEG